MRPPDRRNPFNELYLSEAIDDPALYLRWFSPTILIGGTGALFRRGNTVLRGSNGVGKTMLLKLFAPQVRASYWQSGSGLGWPIPIENALGIGVNFIHAGFGSLGGRRLATCDQENREQWGPVFADLLNYYLINELLKTLHFLQRAGSNVATRIGADVTTARLDRFATTLANHECWFGGLGRINDFPDLAKGVQQRIAAYRSFVNWNTRRLPTPIYSSKTVIGTPLLVARESMSREGVLPKEVALVVALDQYETLYHTDYGRDPDDDCSLGRAFCRVVNSLLALRSPSISYKVGVRHYAWGREVRGFNTDARLEQGRDYHLVDLDEVLRRRENTTSWIFPRFAEDVAERRLHALGRGGGGEDIGWFKRMIGTLTPAQEIDRYCRADPGRLMPGRDEDWPPQWKRFFSDLYTGNKYEAKLAEVWVRQNIGRAKDVFAGAPPSGGKLPWNKPWWEKERREALLTQIASACAQRRLYHGWDTLLTLSASNILVFISLCREMWDHWERLQEDRSEEEGTMAPDVQSQAVRIVSNNWLEKQEEFPRGTTRRQFVVRLGVALRKALIADRGLVYPGRTGFSLTEDELDADEVVRGFLEDAVDYGALVSFSHTTKERDGRRRRKWYLSPILCPNFEIPAIRTKEPYYARVAEVRKWLAGGPITVGSRSRRRTGESSGENGWLFDGEE